MIKSLFPEEVIIRQANPWAIDAKLYPEEEKYIVNAVLKRKKEFIAGRVCAREALEILNVTNFPLLMGKDRAPQWPTGIVGSITHTKNYCGAAIAGNKNIKSIGLDVEFIKNLGRDCWNYICTDRELSWINSLSETERNKNIFFIFSAKECFYKYQYPLSGKWLNFHDAVVFKTSKEGEFNIELKKDVDVNFKKGGSLKGKYLFSEGYVCTGMAL